MSKFIKYTFQYPIIIVNLYFAGCQYYTGNYRHSSQTAFNNDSENVTTRLTPAPGPKKLDAGGFWIPALKLNTDTDNTDIRLGGGYLIWGVPGETVVFGGFASLGGAMRF